MKTITTIILSLSIILLVSTQSFSAKVVWDGGGDGTSWSDANNWDGNSVPALLDGVTLNCSCTITVSADLVINGSLSIASGTILDMGGKKLKVGEGGNNTAFLTNDGIIQNASEVKIGGNGYVGTGPYLTNSGTITAVKFKVGNNNGGGFVTNNALGEIFVTNSPGNAAPDESMHVDGTLNNIGTITVTIGVSFHGAIVYGCGTTNASTVEFEAGKGFGGATGAETDIQCQNFSDGAGCVGSNSAKPLFYVIGGTGNETKWR